MRAGSQCSSCSITWLMRRPVRRSTPFISETMGASLRAIERPHGLEVLAHRLARDRQVDLLGALERLGEVVRGVHVARQIDAGKVLAVALALLDLARQLRAARPHGHVRTAVGEDLAERRSPAARADHGDARAGGILPTAQGAPSPSGRDRPGSSARAAPARPRSCESSPAMSAITTSVASTSAD